MEKFSNYIANLAYCAQFVEEAAIQAFVASLDDNYNRIFIAGNGGSAAVASHFVVDTMKTGRTGSVVCLSDNVPLLTAQCNDLIGGWPAVYENILEMHNPRRTDTLIVISSSGESKNMLRLIEITKQYEMQLIVMTGFKADNTVREAGMRVADSIDFHVPSDNYGIVEDCHMAILHHVTQKLMENAR